MVCVDREIPTLIENAMHEAAAINRGLREGERHSKDEFRRCIDIKRPITLGLTDQKYSDYHRDYE